MLVLFVHGTGVRREGFNASMEKIKHGLTGSSLAHYEVEGCLWGDPIGTNLKEGKSIPSYKDSGGRDSPTEEDLEIELWMHLYSDPLYELRVLALRPEVAQVAPIGKWPASDRLDKHVRTRIVSPELRRKLEDGEIDSTFEKARSDVMKSHPYREMLKTVADPMGPFQDAVARSVVAQAIWLAKQADPRPPNICWDSELRDETVGLLRAELGPYQAGLFEWLMKKVLGTGRAFFGTGMATVGTPLMKWRRGTLMDGASPLTGDILRYQSRAKLFQDFIRMRINELTPPVMVIGHSLGGIAMVDLLIQEDLREHVSLLVTVGSQAPYFYEIDALQSLKYGRKLPRHFPTWVNIYDPRDFLSFCGAELFPGRVTDHRVNNRQPFPESHSAYFNNPEFYAIIKKAARESVR
jgi:hypothetical protein